MISFFHLKSKYFFLVKSESALIKDEVEKLKWLFGEAEKLNEDEIKSFFVGPRKEMITPWSTNAVEICMNMGIEGIERIEEFTKVESESAQAHGTGLAYAGSMGFRTIKVYQFEESAGSI